MSKTSYSRLIKAGALDNPDYAILKGFKEKYNNTVARLRKIVTGRHWINDFENDLPFLFFEGLFCFCHNRKPRKKNRLEQARQRRRWAAMVDKNSYDAYEEMEYDQW